MNNNNNAADRRVIYTDDLELDDGSHFAMVVVISKSRLGHFTADLKTLREEHERVTGLNLIPGTKHEKMALERVLEKLKAFANKWGQGAVPQEMRIQWNEIERDVLSRRATVFDDNDLRGTISSSQRVQRAATPAHQEI